jgi:hypothetical protein
VSEDDSASSPMLEKEGQDDDDTQLHTGVAIVGREARIPYIYDQHTVLLRRGPTVMKRCVGNKNLLCFSLVNFPRGHNSILYTLDFPIPLFSIIGSMK